MSMNTTRGRIGVISAPELPNNNISIKFDLAQRQSYFGIKPPLSGSNTGFLDSFDLKKFSERPSMALEKQSNAALVERNINNKPSSKRGFAQKFVVIANVAMGGIAACFLARPLRKMAKRIIAKH